MMINQKKLSKYITLESGKFKFIYFIIMQEHLIKFINLWECATIHQNRLQRGEQEEAHQGASKWRAQHRNKQDNINRTAEYKSGYARYPLELQQSVNQLIILPKEIKQLANQMIFQAKKSNICWFSVFNCKRQAKCLPFWLMTMRS